ncbi:hypothetical protein JCM19992_10320 [Thermostilla marina]
MAGFDTWDYVILIVTGFLATMILVRLMLRRRDELVQDVKEKITAAMWQQMGEKSRREKEKADRAAREKEQQKAGTGTE